MEPPKQGMTASPALEYSLYRGSGVCAASVPLAAMLPPPIGYTPCAMPRPRPRRKSVLRGLPSPVLPLLSMNQRMRLSMGAPPPPAAGASSSAAGSTRITFTAAQG